MDSPTKEQATDANGGNQDRRSHFQQSRQQNVSTGGGIGQSMRNIAGGHNPNYSDYLKAQRELLARRRHGMDMVAPAIEEEEEEEEEEKEVDESRFAANEEDPESGPKEKENGDQAPPLSPKGRRQSLLLAKGMSAIGDRLTNAGDAAAWHSVVQRMENELKQMDEDGHFDYGVDDSENGGVAPPHGSKIPWYAPPVQRQRWGDDQVLPHINWGDLFFDLFYVAAAYNMGAMLISSMNQYDWLRGSIYFIGIFGPLYLTWETDLYYSSRYTVIDYTHRLVEVLRYLVVSVAVLHIKSVTLLGDAGNSVETFALTLAILLESMLHLGLNVELYILGQGDQEAIRNHTSRKIKSQLIPTVLTYLAAVICAAVLFFGSFGETSDYPAEKKADPYPTGGKRWLAGEEYYDKKTRALWEVSDLPLTLTAFAYVSNIVYTTLRKVRATGGKYGDIQKTFVPNNVDYLIHRYGEWVMLMIGESILSLMIVDTTESPDYYTIAILGSMTVIVLHALKFESEPSHADGHALWRNMKNATCFALLIQILSMALIVFGVSYKIFLSGVVSGTKGRRHLAKMPYIPDETSTSVFCGSLVVVLISLELMVTTHRGITRSYKRLFKENDELQEVLNWPLVIITFFKVAVLALLATLTTWTTNPTAVTLTGFLVVTAIAVTRIVGWGFVHHEKAIEKFVKKVKASSKDKVKNLKHKVSFAMDAMRHGSNHSSYTGEDTKKASSGYADYDTNSYHSGSSKGSSRGSESLNRREDVYDEMFDAVVLTDMKGFIVKVNQTALDVFGYEEKSEIIGENVSILVGGGDATHHDKYLENFHARGKESSQIGKQRVLKGRRKDGTEFPAIIGIKKSSNKKYLVGYIRDMSAFQNDSDKFSITNLGSLDARVQRLVDDASFDSIVVADLQGIIQAVNDTTVREFRYSGKEDLVGQSLNIIMGDNYASNHNQYLDSFAERTNKDEKVSKVLGKQRLLISKRKDGSEFRCIIGVHQIQGTGLLVGYIRNVDNVDGLKNKDE